MFAPQVTVTTVDSVYDRWPERIRPVSHEFPCVPANVHANARVSSAGSLSSHASYRRCLRVFLRGPTRIPAHARERRRQFPVLVPTRTHAKSREGPRQFCEYSLFPRELPRVSGIDLVPTRECYKGTHHHFVEYGIYEVAPSDDQVLRAVGSFNFVWSLADIEVVGVE